MSALPTGKNFRDKFYIGFFKNNFLTAIMDLILDYPQKNTAFIGLFMVDSQYQHTGTGSRIITEIILYLKKSNYNKIRLGVDKNNPQSYGFWKKNGFLPVDTQKYIIMERNL